MQDYDTTIRHYIEVIHLNRRKLNSYFKHSSAKFRERLVGFMRRTVEKNILKINNSLTEQLFGTKGILVELQSKRDELLCEDLNNFISQIDELILLQVTSNDEVEKNIAREEKLWFPEIKVTSVLLKEIIEVQYDILRILKRCKKSTSHETSELAKEASNCSLISLKSITNRGRTT